MDLKPAKPTKDAPLRADGKVKWGRYNFSGWSTLWKFASEHGVDTSEFSGLNDGALIKAATCRKVAAAIQDNFQAYVAAFEVTDSKSGIAECREDILLWRNCGGYRQY